MKLFELVEQNHALKKEKALEPKDVIEAQKELVQAGFEMLPQEFISLLKYSNGITSEDGVILGLSPQNEALDIVHFNKVHNQSKNKIILGYDDFAFLVYDFQSKCYLFIDREDGMELDDFLPDEFASAIYSILHF